MTNWDRIVDIAEILTAASAVVAVVLATWLGLKAIRVAKADNGQAQQEFLYSQVDGVLKSALALTSAASDLETYPRSSAGEDQRALHRNAEGFQSRIRVLKALKLMPSEPDGTDRLQQFTEALVEFALARQELRREGPKVLRATIFDGTDDTTSRLLADLAKRVHAIPAHQDPLGNKIEACDGQGFSEASDGSPSVAANLREVVDRVDSSATVNESLRLVLPWLRVKLGWWRVQFDEKNEPLWLEEDDDYSGRYFDEYALEVIEPPRPQQAVEDWLDEWPRRFRNLDENKLWKLSPEELTDELLKDISAEFLDRLLGLVSELREGLPKVKVD